ncbi:MAG TPA: FAD-dependent monooxygenase [Kofleriaceae bacterium]|nr:FAD-dependent monooxygenase [Kofleriaceae bacterium]
MTLDALVVGAGPTGLALAGELLRRGLSVRVIDKAAAPTTQSRAIGVQARTLEIFDDLGIADDLVARGNRVEGATMLAGAHPFIEVDFEALDTRFPFILCVSQVETEAVLAALLARRGGAVERSCELVALHQDATGVDAVVRGPGGDETIRASWIVGCDGAHSAVRHAIGGTFAGHSYEETFVLADVHADWDVSRRRVETHFADDGAVACFPLGGDHWRIILTAADALPDPPTLEVVRAVVERRLGRPAALRDAGWISSFRIHCRQVERYREGRAFLCGDAAHIHSPVGGQGMNTGIQDAHNLAWKLALVARGRGRPALLDSYHAERHAIGRRVLAQTDLATRLGLARGLAASIRNQVARFVTSFEPVRSKLARDAAELTVGYPQSPIVGEHVRSILVARLGSAEAAESPTLASHRAFAAGPGPGARAPDGAIAHAGGATRLGELRRGDAFTLLLFDGRSATPDGYAAQAALAGRIRARWGDLVRVHVVTPRAERPHELPAELDVIHDRAGELEARYGAHSDCLYLVRPDLYVGFRSQPASGAALDEHLATILTAG